MWGDHVDASLKESLIERIGVVSLVSDQALWLLLQKAACQSRRNNYQQKQKLIADR